MPLSNLRSVGNAQSRRPQNPVNRGRNGVAGMYTTNTSGSQIAQGAQSLLSPSTELSVRPSIPSPMMGSDTDATMRLVDQLRSSRSLLRQGRQGPSPVQRRSLSSGTLDQMNEYDRQVEQLNQVGTQAPGLAQWQDRLRQISQTPGGARAYGQIQNFRLMPGGEQMLARFGQSGAQAPGSGSLLAPPVQVAPRTLSEQEEHANRMQWYNNARTLRTDDQGREVRLVQTDYGPLAIREDGALTSMTGPLSEDEVTSRRQRNQERFQSMLEDPAMVQKHLETSQRRGKLTKVARSVLENAGIKAGSGKAAARRALAQYADNTGRDQTASLLTGKSTVQNRRDLRAIQTGEGATPVQLEAKDRLSALGVGTSPSAPASFLQDLSRKVGKQPEVGDILAIGELAVSLAGQDSNKPEDTQWINQSGDETNAAFLEWVDEFRNSGIEGNDVALQEWFEKRPTLSLIANKAINAKPPTNLQKAARDMYDVGFFGL